MNVPIKRFDKSQPLPSYTGNAACFDLFCREKRTIAPGAIELVPLNVAIQVPNNHVMLLFVRSSTPHKKGLVLANGVGVIDPFYCGDDDEILAMFRNITDKEVVVEPGDRLVQAMILKFDPVVWQETDHFGESGHGGYQHPQ